MFNNLFNHEISIQDQAIQSIYQKQPTLIIGAAGVGKSTLYRSVSDFLHKSTYCAGSTGISAINVNGVTAHRLFHIPFGIPTRKDFEKIAKSRYLKKLFGGKSKVEFILLDEFSMLNSVNLYWIDYVLRTFKDPSLPFGGLGFAMFGDLFQLGAVIKNEEKQILSDYFGSPFIYDSKTFESSGFSVFHLQEVKRQNNLEMIKHLNNIRVYGMNFNIAESIEYFNDNCLNKKLQLPVNIVTTNAKAEEINKVYYDLINSKEYVFKAIVDNFKEEPVPSVLKLKVGARVMLLVNNSEDGYVNGSKATITDISGLAITVMLDSGEEVDIERNTWESFEYTTDPDGELLKKKTGSFTQFPMKLAYAMTVHKSQGLSIDKALVDLGEYCFAPALPYVALSRVKTLEGLAMTRPLRRNDIKVDHNLLRFARERGLI